MIQIQPKVSVIIFSYNHGLFVSDAIRSVLRQNYPDIELIISDDCSTDRSVEIINEALKDHSNSNIKIKTRFGAENMGIAHHFNEAIKMATGEYIFGLASDDFFGPERISVCMSYFAEYNIDLIACDATVVDEKNNIIADSFYFSDNDEGKRIIKPQSPVLYKELPMNTSAGFVRGGFGLCYRKRILDPYNGSLPESITHEDDFLSFLGLVNKGVLFIPERLVYYRRTGINFSGFSASTEKEEVKKTINRILAKQNTVLREKINYLMNNDVENPYYRYNKKKLINAISFKELRNRIIINYCNNESYFERIFLLFKMIKTRQGYASTMKIILAGVFPYLTWRYVLSQNETLRRIFIN